jgi:hypothetical protein
MDYTLEQRRAQQDTRTSLALISGIGNSNKYEHLELPTDSNRFIQFGRKALRRKNLPSTAWGIRFELVSTSPAMTSLYFTKLCNQTVTLRKQKFRAVN